MSYRSFIFLSLLMTALVSCQGDMNNPGGTTTANNAGTNTTTTNKDAESLRLMPHACSWVCRGGFDPSDNSAQENAATNVTRWEERGCQVGSYCEAMERLPACNDNTRDRLLMPGTCEKSDVPPDGSLVETKCVVQCRSNPAGGFDKSEVNGCFSAQKCVLPEGFSCSRPGFVLGKCQ